MNRNDPSPEEILRLESRLEDAILGGGEKTDDSQVSARVLGKVRGYVRSTPPATARGWSTRLLVITAIAAPATVAAALALAVISGQFQKAVVPVPAGSPVPSPVASPQASPSAAAAQMAIVEISMPPNLTGPVSVHWVGLDGKELATQQLPSTEAMLGSGGSRVLVYRNDGHVLALQADGSTTDLGGGMPSTSAPGQTSVPVRAFVSPDGTQWIWSTMTSQGTSFVSHVWLGTDGQAPREVANATEANRALQPYSWTLPNPLIAHSAVGVGGYILFNQAHGPVEQLDLASGKTKPVGAPNNGGNPASAVDLAGNGTVAYVQAQGTMGFVVVSGPTGQRGLSANVPASNQTGGLLFDAGSNHLVFATSPAAGPPHERFETDIIDLNSGAHQKFGPADLRPAAWLPDGRLVEFRTSSDGDGSPGTYLVSLDGTATQVSSYDIFVGTAQVTVTAP
jgi:hypothetical protein